MKKLHRTALVAGMLAFGVAACGDDVTVVEPTPPPPPPLSVTLTPSNAAVAVGEVADFAVGVSGGAEGATASWTCASSNTGVATVSTTDSGCRATGVAAGSASITATVTKGNQSSNAGAQLVVAAVADTPATVSIASINQGGTPADIENIQGQIDVTLNVDPKDEVLEQVDLLVDGVVVASQTFAAAVVAEDEAALAQQQITISFRTDFYSIDEEAGTADPRHLNGDRVISAALSVVGGDSPRPSNTVPVFFNNTSGFHVIAGLPTNSAMDNQGRIWYGGPEAGDVTITAIPVLYLTGGTAQSVTAAFAGCTAAPATGTEAPFTFTFDCEDIETGAAGAAPGFSSIVDGNVGPTAILNNQPRFGLSAHPFPVRVDFLAPQGGDFWWRTDAAIQNRENWVNAQYRLHRTIVTAPTDGGVGFPADSLMAREFWVVDATDNDVVLAQGPEATVHADVDNSVDNNAYTLLIRWVDRLGNARVVEVEENPGATTIDDIDNNFTFTKSTFGIDKDAPVLAIAGDFEEEETILLEDAGETFDIQATDVISGFAVAASGHGLAHTLVQVNGTPGSATLTRVVAAGFGDAVATPFATARAGDRIVADSLAAVTTYVRTPTSLTFSQGILANAGYFIYQAQVRDKAGNSTPLTSRFVYNSEQSIPDLSSVAVTTALQGGQPAAFPAVGSDDVELWQWSFDLNYAGVRLVFNRPAPQIATLFDDEITIPNSFSFQTAAFIRSLHVVDGANEPTGEGAKPATLNAIAYNGWASEADPSHVDAAAGASALFGNSASFAATINPALVQDGVDWSDMDPQLQIETWAPVSYSTGDEVDGQVTATVRVRAVGPPSTFLNPFAAAVVVEADGGFVTPLDIGLMADFNAPFPTTDSGTERRFDWTFQITRDELDLVDLHVVGLNSGFDALATQVFTIDFTANQTDLPLP